MNTQLANKTSFNSLSIKPIALLLFTLSTLSASAANIDNNTSDLEIFNQAMNQLEQVEIDDNIYISTVSESFEDITVETEYMSEYALIERVTDKQADEMGLHETKSYYIYSINGLNDLTNNVERHLHKDEPTYFSVTLMRGNKYYHGFSEYIAKVAEYKL